MGVREYALHAKEAAIICGTLDDDTKNRAINAICDALIAQSEKIENANALDIELADKDGLAPALRSRLGFYGKKLTDTVEGARALAGLEDPCNRIIFQRDLADGLTLTKKSCGIGVIGVIFESRPDALVQIAMLCIKSGNAAILKGGKEAHATNTALAEIIIEAGIEAGLPDGFLTLLTSREEINELLSCDDCVDLLIPRGSGAFVKYIMDNTRIPVMGHADGVCHIYVDGSADMKKATDIVVDSKTQYPAACNSVETLLVDATAAQTFLPEVTKALREKGVTLVGWPRTCAVIDCEQATEEDWSTEYVGLKLSVRIVDSVYEAVRHINKYGSGHTDCIVTQDNAVADFFINNVDSAGVYKNCSTRFADGYRYGFGAEVGISTGKLHARGPVGIEGLVSYRYLLEGDGDIVADFASGKRKFMHQGEV